MNKALYEGDTVLTKDKLLVCLYDCKSGGDKKYERALQHCVSPQLWTTFFIDHPPGRRSYGTFTSQTVVEGDVGQHQKYYLEHTTNSVDEEEYSLLE